MYIRVYVIGMIFGKGSPPNKFFMQPYLVLTFHILVTFFSEGVCVHVHIVRIFRVD